MRWLVLLVVAAVAGCASDSSTTSPGTFSNSTSTIFPQLFTYNATLASGSFDVGPTGDAGYAQPLAIPNGTMRVNVTLTFLAGGSADGLVVHVSTCNLRFPGPIAATGQNLTLDCGGLASGAARLRIDAPSGRLQGGFLVQAEVCRAVPQSASCPKAAPVS